MADSRGSRCSDNETLVIYVDGIALSRPRKDFGCSGEVHAFTAVTTLQEPVTYKWSLDGISPPKPLLGRTDTYYYTFDDKKHSLFVVATSLQSQCAIQVDIKVTGKLCTLCVTECVLATAYIPSGVLTALKDYNGNTYLIDGKTSVECKSNSKSNVLAKKAILRTIRSAAGCKTDVLNASIYFNNASLTPNCLTLTITNSPIKFKSIVIGDKEYTFDISRC